MGLDLASTKREQSVIEKNISLLGEIKNEHSAKLSELTSRLTSLADEKCSQVQFNEYTKEVDSKLNKEINQLQRHEDALTTLENYCELYIPVVQIQQIKELIRPILSEEKLKKFNLLAGRIHRKLTC